MFAMNQMMSKHMPSYLSPPPGNFLQRLLAALLGAAVLIGSIFLGAVALVLFAGLGLCAWLWLWWQRRQLLKRAGAQPQTGRSTAPGDALETEYRVVATEPSQDATERKPEG